MTAKSRSSQAVASFEKLHKAFAEYWGGWIFRGHSSETWRLVPKSGRSPFQGTKDKDFFESWKRKAIALVSPRPDSDWDWLAIAQHHGLATRLLDWTTNPLNAAFFAVGESLNEPAVIHAAKFHSDFARSIDLESLDPFENPGIFLFKPSGVVPRIIRQDGLFTIHDPPERPLEELPVDVVTLRKIVITTDYRAKLLSELAYYGVNSASLFADLDGLSKHLNWTIETGEFMD